MVKIGLVVPVFRNFEGLARLLHSVDSYVYPLIINNWDENIGVSKGWNEGIRQAIANRMDVAVVINDDIVLEPGTLSTLVNGAFMYDVATAVNTRDFPEPGSGDPDEPDFSCFAIRPKSFIDKFGWFDENFTPAYFEDNDMSYRIKVLGGTQKKLLNARMYHSGSVTQNWGGLQVVTPFMFERNRDYYRAKWGGVPGEEKFINPFDGITGKKASQWVTLGA